MSINNVILGQNLKKIDICHFLKRKKSTKHAILGFKIGSESVESYFKRYIWKNQEEFFMYVFIFNLGHFTWHLWKECYVLPNVSPVHQITEATERRTKESNHGMKSSENMMS